MFKSSFIVMAINMLSRLLGLIREMIIGSMFGATGLTDTEFFYNFIWRRFIRNSFYTYL